MATQDIKEYAQKATAYLEKDLVKTPLNKIMHKIIIKHMMHNDDEFHPYERLGLSGRDEFRTLLCSMYPTVCEEIVNTDFKLCNRKVIGRLCGEKITCNSCRVAVD